MGCKLLFLVTLIGFYLLPADATTVAWDGKTLAADTQATLGHHKTFSPKIARSDIRGASIACSGNALMADLVIDYFIHSDKPLSQMEMPVIESEDDLIFALVVYDTGIAVFYGGDLKSLSIVEAPFVMGSGGDIALGAMLTGKTAVEAVEIARDHDIYTGGKIDFLQAPKIQEFNLVLPPNDLHALQKPTQKPTSSTGSASKKYLELLKILVK